MPHNNEISKDDMCKIHGFKANNITVSHTCKNWETLRYNLVNLLNFIKNIQLKLGQTKKNQ